MSTSNPSPSDANRSNPYAPPTSFAAETPPSATETNGNRTSERTVELLRQTRPWVLFFSVLGFILSAIIVCFGLIAVSAGFRQPSAEGIGRALGGTTVFVIFGVLYFFPALYLGRFAGRIRDLTHTHRLDDLEAALAEQKAFWRFCGITSVLILAFYAVIIFIGVAFSMVLRVNP